MHQMKDFMLQVVRINPSTFEYASDELKRDTKFVSQVGKFHDALEFASDESKGDKQVVLEATKRSNSSASFASAALKKEMDLSALFTPVKTLPPSTSTSTEFQCHSEGSLLEIPEETQDVVLAMLLLSGNEDIETRCGINSGNQVKFSEDGTSSAKTPYSLKKEMKSFREQREELIRKQQARKERQSQ